MSKRKEEAKKIVSKINLKEVHEILAIELRDFNYMVIAQEKQPPTNEEGQLYIASNYSKTEAILLLTGILKSMVSGSEIDVDETTVTDKEVGL